MQAFGEARHVLAVQRAQRAVLARSPRPPQRSRWRAVHARFWFLAGTLGLPLLVVMAAWEDARSPRDTWVRPWALGACLAVMVGSGQLFLMDTLSFSPRDVLFHPSKAGVLLARLARDSWRFAVIGAGWAFACFAHVAQASGTPALTIATCCAVAFLAPLAWNTGNLLRRVVAPDTHSSLPSLVVLAVLVYGLGESLFWHGGTAGPHWSELLILGVVGAAVLAGLVLAWWRAPRAELRALWPDVVRLPRVFVMFVLIAPAPWLREHHALLAAIAMPHVVVFTALGLRHLLAAVNGAEAETRGAVVHEVTEHDVPQETGPPRRAAPPPHRGRSPWRATWRLHWLQNGITRRELWHPIAIWFLLRHGTLLAIAAALVWADQRGPAPMLLLLWLPLPIATGIVSREHLYLLGVDLSLQARQNVLTVSSCAALPALLTAALVGTACGWNETRAVMLAAIAAAFLLRLGWRGLLPRPESVSTGAAFALFATLFAAAEAAMLLRRVPRPGIDPGMLQRMLAQGRADLALEATVVQWPIVGAFAALGLIGLVRRIALWREGELLADLVAERERESQPAA